MGDSGSDGAVGKAKESRQFFVKELAGEQPLSFETASQLSRVAMELFALRPWEFLEEQELILIRDSESGEICYCSIMGALGQVYSCQVYAGAESFRFFRRIVSRKPLSGGDFLAAMRGVSAEFVTAKERTPPDRELLDAVGHLSKRGRRAPIFRALRPGYHPWYVTESEAKTLAYCLQGVCAFCRLAEEFEDYWENEDVFPLLVPKTGNEASKSFEIRLVTAPEPPVAASQPAPLDEALISEILHKNLPRSGALEADHVFTTTPIGHKNERKACMRVAMVTDARSGFAFMPELGRPEQATGELLVRALLGAMRDGRRLPREVRVRHKDHKILLSALSQRLNIDVHIMKSLPALDHLKEDFLATIGDAGDFSD